MNSKKIGTFLIAGIVVTAIAILSYFLKPTTIEESVTTETNTQEPTKESVSQDNINITLTGTLVEAKRPDPDIPYDFTLEMAEPLHGWDSRGDGLGITSVYITTGNDQITPETRKKLDASVGQQVTLKGGMRWGYAGNSHLVVDEILK